jgi:hypothetical protein
MKKTKIILSLAFGVFILFGLVALSSGFKGTIFESSDKALERGAAGKNSGYPKIDSLVFEKFAELKEGGEVEVIISIRDGLGNVFEDNSAIETLVSEIGEERITYVFLGNHAFSAFLTLDEVKDISKRQEVVSIEANQDLELLMQDVANIIGASNTWELHSGGLNLDGTGNTVCIIDIGVDFSHPDLTGKNIAGGNIDCTDINGPCFVNTNVILPSSHGTAIAGIAAADGGITGVSKGANIISIYAESPTTPNAISLIYAGKGIDWCAQHAQQYNISVISMSFGSTNVRTEANCITGFFPMSQSVNNALTNGILSVAGAGNNNVDAGIVAPACLPNVIAVGATTKQDYRADLGWWGSNYYAPLMKVFAPGVDINTTDIGGGYRLAQGTSMSTPVVSASVAIITQFLDANGMQRMTPQAMEQHLFNTGELIHDLSFNDFRRINLFNAIAALDSGAPIINVTSPVQGGNYITNVPLRFDVQDELLDSCWYSLDGGQTNTTVVCGQDSNLNWQALTNGNNTLTLYANDQLGLESYEEIDFTFARLGLVEAIRINSSSHGPVICDPWWAC